MKATPVLLDDFRSVAVDDLPPHVWHHYLVRYATQIGGAPLTFLLCVLRGPEPGPRVTIVAGVHGDEFEGMRALWQMVADNPYPLRCGTLTVVPIVNIPAYEAGTRTSPLDGINLARVFPGSAQGTPSERLAAALFEQVVVGSSLLVDLHSGGIRYLHSPLAGFLDVPDEVGQASLAAARALGWLHLWAAPLRAGVLGYEAVRHGIPAVGTEVGGAGRCLPADVGLYHPSLGRLLAHAGLFEQPEPVPPVAQTIIDGDWWLCPQSGFLDTRVTLSQVVTAGDLLGCVLDQFGAPVAELYAQRPGVIVGVRAFPPIQAGEWGIFAGMTRRS